MTTAGSRTKRKAKFFISVPGLQQVLKCLNGRTIFNICIFFILLFLLLFSLLFVKMPAVFQGGRPGDLVSPLHPRLMHQETAQLTSKREQPAEEQKLLTSKQKLLPQEQARLLLQKIDQPLSLTEVSPTERNLLIYLYESAWPEQAEDLCTFLSGVSSPEDIKNIKYTVYTAPAAWRTAFLEASKQLHLCCRPGRDCYIAGSSRTVCVDMDAASADPRGPYTSFFHECAHGVCDVLYSVKLKKAELSAQLAAETSLLSADRVYCEPWEEAVSDMRSAFSVASQAQSSEAAQKTGYVHEASYWKTPDMPAKEFFAEYFSYRICRNGKALDCLENDCSGVYPLSSHIVCETIYNTAL